MLLYSAHCVEAVLRVVVSEIDTMLCRSDDLYPFFLSCVFYVDHFIATIVFSSVGIFA
jgi:hypothetical protein